jgi:pimeloyl-ACP methyl ester carboxylesterase
MNECSPDGKQCASICPGPDAPECATCPSHAPRTLSDISARFWRESLHGSCRTGRYRMPYWTWGSGPPLVFIHGVADNRASFILPAAYLSAHFRCIAYDLPNGHDDGSRLWSYRHEHLVADLWALLDQLGVERSYVLGSSFGSTVALAALGQRPERLPRAVLQGPFVYRPLRRAERWLSSLARFLPGPTARIPRRAKLLELVHGKPFRGQPPEVWRAFLEWTGRARLAALGHQAQWLHRLDLRPLLPFIRQPVLLICGDCDPAVPLHHAEAIHSALPAGGMVVLEGCGHLPSYTHPEPLAEVVRQFLTPPPLAAGRLASAPASAACGRFGAEKGQSPC